MKTTLRYAACAVFFALVTFPALVQASASGGLAVISKKAAPTTYTVKFKPNGGSGKMSAQTFTVDKAGKLSSNRFKRKGYVFVGWSKTKSGAVAYKNGKTVTNLAKGGKTATLYAQWAVKNYLVAFFANGGSGSMSPQKHVYGKSANLSAKRFTRKGHSFSGWATKSKGTVKYRNKAAVKNLTRTGKTIKLYAVWKVKEASSTTTYTADPVTGDEVDFALLNWTYGGFNGSAAKVSGKARISSLKASNSGLTYAWASGGCQNLGASSASDASCVACLFCYSGGKWSGGKFDWICTDNQSPSFKNIQDQYKGWSDKVLSKAEEYAFVILSKNGASRTNVIRVKSPGFTSGSTSTVSTSTVSTSTSSTSTSSAKATDEVDFSLLNWTYGGFNGSGAKLASKPRIAGLNVSSNGMSYSWKSGGCENLGASSATDPACIAALFVYIGGKWVGGKFDWISTSRQSRDFENIKTSYNGWDKKAISKGDAYAFVIVSSDGKSRTNVIRCGK